MSPSARAGSALPNADALARDMLDMVGLSSVAKAWPSTLSGGMQQRVGLARALATRPPVLLMDEPFGALDAQTRGLMQAELLKIWMHFRTTLVFVTHDIDEAVYLADRVVVMRTLPGTIGAEFQIALDRPRDPAVMESSAVPRISPGDCRHYPGRGAQGVRSMRTHTRRLAVSPKGWVGQDLSAVGITAFLAVWTFASEALNPVLLPRPLAVRGCLS